MEIRAAFFDLDETLYPLGNKVVYLLGERMNQFIEDKLAIPHDEVRSFRIHYIGLTERPLKVW